MADPLLRPDRLMYIPIKESALHINPASHPYQQPPLLLPGGMPSEPSFRYVTGAAACTAEIDGTQTRNSTSRKGSCKKKKKKINIWRPSCHPFQAPTLKFSIYVETFPLSRCHSAMLIKKGLQNNSLFLTFSTFFFLFCTLFARFFCTTWVLHPIHKANIISLQRLAEILLIKCFFSIHIFSVFKVQLKKE